MRKIIFCLCLLLAGKTHAQFRADGCGCPIPQGDTVFGGERRMPVADMKQHLSGDGRTLVLVVDGGDGGAYILDLQTLTRKLIVVHGNLPGEQDLGGYYPAWCPYDSDLIALIVPSLIDTSNSGNPTVYVSNLFTYRISTGESRLITPVRYKEKRIGVLQFFGWSLGSLPGRDTLIIPADSAPTEGIGFYALYVPQTQRISYVPGNTTFLGRSENGHVVKSVADNVPPYNTGHLYLDDSEIQTVRNIQALYHASFSPNNKLVALTVDPAGTGGGGVPVYDNNWDTVFQQVWIFSSNNPHPDSSQMKVINFQCLFCTYNFHGAWAEFLTDSTLAVSMHKDGDTNSWLWEITIDGRIVRQLTFLPEFGSVVRESAPLPTFTLHPSPASERIIVSIPDLSGASKFSVMDAVGRTVITRDVPAGIGSFEVETAALPDGVYFCQLVSPAGVWSEKMVVRH